TAHVTSPRSSRLAATRTAIGFCVSSSFRATRSRAGAYARASARWRATRRKSRAAHLRQTLHRARPVQRKPTAFEFGKLWFGSAEDRSHLEPTCLDAENHASDPKYIFHEQGHPRPPRDVPAPAGAGHRSSLSRRCPELLGKNGSDPKYIFRPEWRVAGTESRRGRTPRIG